MILTALAAWLRRIEWLWSIIGGFYLLAYLFWYLPALVRLPRSAWEPPSQYPWHWTLDFVVTAVTGVVLVYLGFQRATRLSAGEETPAVTSE